MYVCICVAQFCLFALVPKNIFIMTVCQINRKLIEKNKQQQQNRHQTNNPQPNGKPGVGWMHTTFSYVVSVKSHAETYEFAKYEKQEKNEIYEPYFL
jgi:hypothetical protein